MNLLVWVLIAAVLIMGVFAAVECVVTHAQRKRKIRVLTGSRIMMYNSESGDYEPLKFI